MAGEHDFTPMSEARQGVLRLRGVMVTVVATDSLWFELRLCAVRLQRRLPPEAKMMMTIRDFTRRVIAWCWVLPLLLLLLVLVPRMSWPEELE